MMYFQVLPLISVFVGTPADPLYFLIFSLLQSDCDASTTFQRHMSQKKKEDWIDDETNFVTFTIDSGKLSTREDTEGFGTRGHHHPLT